jgi:hypothetical protein
MLKYAQNRLWIARLELPIFHEHVAPLAAQKATRSSWMIQPTLYKEAPGFLANVAILDRRKTSQMAHIVKSLEVFSDYSLLQSFWSY